MLKHYAQLQEIPTTVHLKHYPNTRALTANLADANHSREQQHLREDNTALLLQPAVTHFHRHFNRELQKFHFLKQSISLPEECQTFIRD